MTTPRACARCGTEVGPRKTYCSDFCRTARPCKRCGTLKTGPGYCLACRRDRLSGQALTLDPEWLERQATRDTRPQRRPTKDVPAAMGWCSGCREWLSPRWFYTWAQMQTNRTLPSLCRPCRSARSHKATLRRDFGMSPQDYAALLDLQGGGCAICGGKPRTTRLAVDHDHTTGEVRGLLCKPCNADLLDGVRHSVTLAARAAAYLVSPPAQTGHAVPEVTVLSVADLRLLVDAATWACFAAGHEAPSQTVVVEDPARLRALTERLCVEGRD